MSDRTKETLEQLEIEIDNLTNVLLGMDPSNDDYKYISQNLKTLYEARKECLNGEKIVKETEAIDAKNDLAEAEAEIKKIEANTKKELVEAEIRLKKAEAAEREVRVQIAEEDLKNLKFEQNKTFWQKIDPSVVVKGVVAIVGIGLVLKHEKLEVITSKAFGFIPRLLC